LLILQALGTVSANLRGRGFESRRLRLKARPGLARFRRDGVELGAAAWTVGYPRRSMKIPNKATIECRKMAFIQATLKARNSGPDISPDPFSCRALRFANNARNVLVIGVERRYSIHPPPYLCGPGAPDRRGPRRGTVTGKGLALLSWRAATEPTGHATEGSLDDGPRFAGDGIEGRRTTPVQH
jgi:hypothetical protein